MSISLPEESNKFSDLLTNPLFIPKLCNQSYIFENCKFIGSLTGTSAFYGHDGAADNDGISKYANSTVIIKDCIFIGDETDTNRNTVRFLTLRTDPTELEDINAFKPIKVFMSNSYIKGGIRLLLGSTTPPKGEGLFFKLNLLRNTITKSTDPIAIDNINNRHAVESYN